MVWRHLSGDDKNFFASMPTDPEAFLKLYPEYILPEDQKQAWPNTRTGGQLPVKCSLIDLGGKLDSAFR